MKFRYGNLGKTIARAINLKVCAADGKNLPAGCAYDGALSVGNFLFGSNSHDTGISVHVYIEHPESLETLEIICGTYWYSESRYGFNKFTWKDGKWSNALGDAVATIESEIKKAEGIITEKQKEMEDKKAKSEQKTKAVFEGIF